MLVVGIPIPQAVFAHRSGCHNLHTCPSDNNTYVCGDLGYPCDGSTSLKNIAPSKIHVPLLVESIFKEIFGRAPSDIESTYWKKRFRAEKNSVYKIRRAMAWHQVKGSFGPPESTVAKESLIKNMNSLFQSVYGRMPTVSENQYWLSRIKDKPTEQAIKGAMVFHKANNIQH